jgi:hypothetical protein
VNLEIIKEQAKTYKPASPKVRSPTKKTASNEFGIYYEEPDVKQKMYKNPILRLQAEEDKVKQIKEQEK